MDDLSIEELERRVNETKRRLELIRELSELDKQLGVQQPQDAAQAENIVEVEATQAQIHLLPGRWWTLCATLTRRIYICTLSTSIMKLLMASNRPTPRRTKTSGATLVAPRC